MKRDFTQDTIMASFYATTNPSLDMTRFYVTSKTRLDVLSLGATGSAHEQQQLFDFVKEPSEGSRMSQRTEQDLPQSRHYLPIRNEPKERGIHSLQTNIQPGQQNAGKW